MSRTESNDAGTGTAGRADRRAELIAAAFASLREVGYAGTSIRSIARRGGFNSALISYYFGGLHELLLAALDDSSATRMRRYSEAVEQAEDLESLAAVARRIYKEDVEGGHITVFSEMVAASLAHPELKAELVNRAEPWIDFVDGALRKLVGDAPILGSVTTRDAAYALVCFYLGVNLMTQLEDDSKRLDAFFESIENLAPVLSPLLQGAR